MVFREAWRCFHRESMNIALCEKSQDMSGWIYSESVFQGGFFPWMEQSTALGAWHRWDGIRPR